MSNMAEEIDEAEPGYGALETYAERRTKQLSELLKPYIAATDRYGDLICRITLILGKVPPTSKEEAMQRDLMADVFDFLYEARILIVKGKTEIAYLLARRAYESLSLMVACQLEPELAHGGFRMFDFKWEPFEVCRHRYRIQYYDTVNAIHTKG